jgi:hypothetical protein
MTTGKLEALVADLQSRLATLEAEVVQISEARRRREATAAQAAQREIARLTREFAGAAPERRAEMLALEPGIVRDMIKHVGPIEAAAIARSFDDGTRERFMGFYALDHVGAGIERLRLELAPAPEVVHVRAAPCADGGQWAGTCASVDGKLAFDLKAGWTGLKSAWDEAAGNPRNDALRKVLPNLIVEPLEERAARDWAWTHRHDR